jgi:hypothetical protein
MIAMRTLGMGLVVLSTLAASAAAEPFHAVYSSNGVLGDVDIIDGCTETTGTLIVSTTDEGTVAGFFGISTDICGVLGPDGGPLSDGQFGFGLVDYTSNGLGLATTSGSFSTFVNNSQFVPLTFELSLTFTGTGGTLVEPMHSSWGTPGESTTLDFSVSRRRAATVTGSLTVNGDAIELINPFLGTGVSGSINVNH